MMTVILMLAAIAAVLVLILNWRKRASTSTHDVSECGNEFHAVSVRAGAFACHNARNLNGNRYLSNEAPALPLPGCREEKCTCRFVHHQDRRCGDDRRLPFQSHVSIAGTTKDFERRLQNDRRDYGDDDSPLFN